MTIRQKREALAERFGWRMEKYTDAQVAAMYEKHKGVRRVEVKKPAVQSQAQVLEVDGRLLYVAADGAEYWLN